ncbi:hypothetical protein ISKNV_00079 [Infectious spleen and kidney necrosis virus]|nr:hypothetical protein ISKNV_00079 [Infectious spleen and kidney necrosis virus]
MRMAVFKRFRAMCTCHYTYTTGPLSSEEMSICAEWQDKWNTCFLPQRVTMNPLCAVIFEHSRDILIRCEQTLAVYRFDLRIRCCTLWRRTRWHCKSAVHAIALKSTAITTIPWCT